MEANTYYRPKNADIMQSDDLKERAEVAANTVKRWRKEHNEQTEYHRRFQGYCIECMYETEPGVD